jgi:hypothetical protein
LQRYYNKNMTKEWGLMKKVKVDAFSIEVFQLSFLSYISLMLINDERLTASPFRENNESWCQCLLQYFVGFGRRKYGRLGY